MRAEEEGDPTTERGIGKEKRGEEVGVYEGDLEVEGT